MTTLLFAQPYDITAAGFYFESVEDYQSKAEKAVNECADPVEEFEIQFIDGEEIDCALAKAFGINQANLARFFEAAEEREKWEKQKLIIAVDECGYDLSQAPDDLDGLDVDVYYLDSMKALAEQFVDEGLFGDIPEYLQNYIDYEAIARDLEMDYCLTEIAGETLIYRCG